MFHILWKNDTLKVIPYPKKIIKKNGEQIQDDKIGTNRKKREPLMAPFCKTIKSK